ncbi:porin [Winogradskyella sp.]|uniref:alginate export family protein n=1 Tax=Winogradskyella sp. TaxID=1883156 RepID=UPI00262A307B|nr:porin [Winogradskyella sp.]
MKASALCIICLVTFTIWSQEDNQLNFSLLRQNDVIQIENPDSFYKQLKQLRLSETTTLSFGGSYRFQTEAFINEQFDKSVDQTDYWFLNRFMLHAHLKVNDKIEVFSELNSSLITSKDNLVPVDRDELSFNQLFFKYHFSDQWELLVGRQNMRLGSGRLVDVREGPNVRLSFDMAQLRFKDSNTEVIAVHAIPVQQQEGVFDNDALEGNEALSVLYWIQHWTEATNTDIYILYKTEENKTWNAGTADDNRASIGLRHFGEWKGLKYNNEFVYQFGSFGDQDIRAWTASFNIESDFSFGTLGLKTEAISGDSDDGALNTFDGLYPRGAYFGRVARFGPSNLFDIHPYLETQLGDVNVQLDYVAFWRLSRNDGLYNPALILEYPSINNERFIGHQLGGIVSYELNKFLNFELESNIIFPGAFLKESGLGDPLYHFVFTTEFKF